MDLCSHGLCQPQAVRIIGEAERGMVIGGADGRQSPAISPGHRRPVVPGGGVANGVVGDGVPVIGCQQIPTVEDGVGQKTVFCPTQRKQYLLTFKVCTSLLLKSQLSSLAH